MKNSEQRPERGKGPNSVQGTKAMTWSLPAPSACSRHDPAATARQLRQPNERDESAMRS